MTYQASWGTSGQSSEKTYYQDAQVLVTSARFQVGGTMYPIRNLAAVGVDERHSPRVEEGNRGPAWLCFIGALTPVCMVKDYPAALAAMPVLFILGVVLLARAKDRHWTESVYAVTVNTNGVQQHAFYTPQREHRDAIVGALHQAIAGG